MMRFKVIDFGCVDGEIRRFMTVAVVLAVNFGLLGCGESQQADREAKTASETAKDGATTVFVSIAPLKYFVERIGQNHVDVEVLLPPGASPATYELTPKRLALLARAKTFFRVGVPFESAVIGKIESTLDELPVVDLRDGIELLTIEAHDHGNEADGSHEEEVHVHGPGCNHAPGELDPHIWMNPQLVQKMSISIRDELIRLRPDLEKGLTANHIALNRDLEVLYEEIRESLSHLRGRVFYVFHPAYGYFAQSFGLKQKAIERGGKQPTVKQLASLIEEAKADGVELIFVQPQFDSRTAETVAKQIGGAVVKLDPLAEDYIANMHKIAQTVNKALSGGGE